MMVSSQVNRWLNISAAFDTIDTDKLLLRLESDFGVCGLASAWISLADRATWPSGISGPMSGAAILAFLREASLGPALFCAFVSPISRIMESNGIRFHQYADDTQLYTEIRSPVSSQMEVLSQCVSALTFWFFDNGLQLSSTMSEAMIFGSRQGLSRLELVASLDIGDGHVEVKDEIKILGVHLDPTLSMKAQVKSLMKTSNFHIRALRC